MGRSLRLLGAGTALTASGLLLWVLLNAGAAHAQSQCDITGTVDNPGVPLDLGTGVGTVSAGDEGSIGQDVQANTVVDNVIKVAKDDSWSDLIANAGAVEELCVNNIEYLNVDADTGTTSGATNEFVDAKAFFVKENWNQGIWESEIDVCAVVVKTGGGPNAIVRQYDPPSKSGIWATNPDDIDVGQDVSFLAFVACEENGGVEEKGKLVFNKIIRNDTGGDVSFQNPDIESPFVLTYEGQSSGAITTTFESGVFDEGLTVSSDQLGRSGQESVPLGEYSVAESDENLPTAPDGFKWVQESGPTCVKTTGSPVASGDNTFELTGAADVVTCSVTNILVNEDETGQFTVVKETIDANDNRITPDVTFTFSGPDGSFTINPTSDPNPEEFSDLAPGEYVITENDPTGDGFGLVKITITGEDGATTSEYNVNDRKAKVKLDAGDDLTITFTNRQLTGKIIVKKVTTTPSSQNFDFNISGGVDTDADFQLKDKQTKEFSLPVGNYTIGEAIPVGWSLDTLTCDSGVTGTTASSVSVSLGDDASINCVFTNKRDTGTLQVVKETIGGNDDFSFLLTGPEGDSFDLRGGEKKVFSSLPTGQYTITETSLPEGWTLKSVSCGQGVGSENGFTVTLDKNESITCTFVNFKEEDEEMEDITKLFIYRRVDNLLSHDPDRARLLRRLQEQQPVSLKDTALPPLKMTGSMDGESGQVQFSTSLSQMRASMMAQDAAKIRKAQTGDGMKSSFADDPYIAPYMMTRPGWDIWIEGQISRYDDTTAGIERDGIFKILYVGADYAIAPGVIVGALVQVDRTDESVDDPDIWGEIEGTGWMVGPYMGAKISDNLMFDARAAWGQSDNDIQLESEDGGFRTGEFETDRWLVTAKLTGLWYHGGWRISPHVGLAWGNEDQDAYINSIGQTIGANSITIGRVTFGPEFGYKHMMLDGSVIEPHIAIEGIWNFDGDDLVIGGTPVDTDEFRAKVEGGVIFATPDGYKLRAAASYDGLGADDFEAWSAKAWLNIPLDRADDPIQ